MLPRRKIISEDQSFTKTASIHLASKVSAELGTDTQVSDRATRLPLLCREPTVGFGRAAAPLTRHRAAGGAAPALPSMQRRGTARNVPAARPPLAPAAPRVARRWRTAAPTCAGRKRHQTPPADPGHEAVPHSPSRQSQGRGDMATRTWEEKEVMQTCLRSHPWEGNLPQGPHPAPSLPGLVWGTQNPPGQVLTVPAQPRCIPGST